MNLRSASREPDVASCGPRASQVARRLTSALLIPTAPSSRSRWRHLDRPDRRRRASALPRLRSPLSARRSTAAIPAESPKQGEAGSAGAVPRFANCEAAPPATFGARQRIRKGPQRRRLGCQLQLRNSRGMGRETVPSHGLALFTSPRMISRAFASTAPIAVGIVSRVRASDGDCHNRRRPGTSCSNKIEGIHPSRPHTYDP